MNLLIVDQMLLRLGRWLRLLGLDVANPNNADDRELLRRARKEQRILLTRDIRLAENCRFAGVGCILIKSSRLEDQLLELAEKGVILELDPKRCTLCNTPLNKVESSLERAIWKCENCGKLYWKGSHWTKMEQTLKNIRSRKA